MDLKTRGPAGVFVGKPDSPGREKGQLTAPRGLAVAKGLLSDLLDVRRGEQPTPIESPLGTPEVLTAVEKHVSNCGECRQELAELEEFGLAFAEPALTEPDEAHFAHYGRMVRERVRRMTQRTTDRPQLRVASQWRTWCAALASSAAAAVLTVVLIHPGTGSRISPDEDIARTTEEPARRNEMIGALDEAQAARWEEIKRTFNRNQLLSGTGGDDRMAQVVSLLSNFGDGLSAIQSAIAKGVAELASSENRSSGSSGDVEALLQRVLTQSLASAGTGASGGKPTPTAPEAKRPKSSIARKIIMVGPESDED